jgi:hypothetical protein
MAFYLDGRHRIVGRQLLRTRGTRPFRGRQITYNRDEDAIVVATAEATVEWRHGGQLLKEGATYWDHGGFMRCIFSLVEDIVPLCQGYRVESRSSLVCCIRVKIFRCLLHAKPLDFLSCHCAHEMIESSKRHELAEFIVWDSRRGWRIPLKVLEHYATSYRTDRHESHEEN